MRNLNFEAAIWYLFTSPEFFETAANDCGVTTKWFENLAILRKVSNFGRNNQIHDTFKKLECNLRRGAALARLGDYQLIFQTAESISGNIRGMMEQPLHSWMNEKEYQEFEQVRISRITAYSSIITLTLHNALMGAISYFGINPRHPERRNDDDGLPGSTIIEWYTDYLDYYKEPLFSRLPDPLPDYAIDQSISCNTGDEVPWTGVWYPGTGLENHSLTFAVKGMRMQAVYKVIKTTEELRTAIQMFPPPDQERSDPHGHDGPHPVARRSRSRRSSDGGAGGPARERQLPARRLQPVGRAGRAVQSKPEHGRHGRRGLGRRPQQLHGREGRP